MSSAGRESKKARRYAAAKLFFETIRHSTYSVHAFVSRSFSYYIKNNCFRFFLALKKIREMYDIYFFLFFFFKMMRKCYLPRVIKISFVYVIVVVLFFKRRTAANRAFIFLSYNS